jgi:hypothetical protein
VSAQDQVDADIKIACSILSLWGAEAVGKIFDMRTVWAEMANDLSAGYRTMQTSPS